MDNNTTSVPDHEMLQQKFEEIKLRNPRWSQRAFAKRLGLSSGALSEILRGKRRLNFNLKQRILQRLDFTLDEREAFLQSELLSTKSPQPTIYTELSRDQFRLIADWWHYGLLNLLKTKGFKLDLPWMAKRLGLNLPVVKEAWERLFRIGFLEQKGRGVVRKFPRLTTIDNIFDLSLRKSHLEDQRLIEKALLEMEPEVRDIVSMTLALRRQDLGRAKELIRRFQDEFGEKLEKKDADEVYKLTIALYPLSQPLTGDENSL